MDEQRLTRLAAMKRHPAWPDLCAELEQRSQEYIAQLARQLVANDRPLDQRRIDEERGFYKAAKFFATIPDLAEKKLKKLNERRDSGEIGDVESA